MMTVFYRDGAEVPAERVRRELLEGAVDARVSADMAEELFDGALAGDACDCEMLEDLIFGLECITEVGFGS
jgi:hypothetical protein